jgi:parallel beta-helix repeat protein
LSVRNGSLSGWQGPDKAALRLEGSNNRIEELQIFSNQMAVAIGPGAQVTQVRAFTNESSSIGPGIFAAGGSVIRDCVVSGNRALGGTALGVFAGDGSVIERCSVYSNEFFASAASMAIGGGSGSVIRGCAAHGNRNADSLTAITVIDGGEVVDCSAYGNEAMSGLGIGINGGNGTVIRNCSSHSNQSFGSHVFGVAAGSGSSISGCSVYRNGGSTTNSAGIFTFFDSLVYDCSVTQNTNIGIRVAGGCQVRDNQVSENGTTGIEVVQGGSIIERNQVKGNPLGISILSSNNFIAANRVTSATSSNNYLIAIGNAYGPIVLGAGAGDLSLTPNANHPLANLSY